MSHVIPLKQYGLIEASGVDAETFLQGQLTCDVGKLAIGQSTVTAHCDPKGKVSAVFRLVRVGEQRFYLLFRTALLPAALDQLKKYAVFSKVGFTPLDYPLVGIIGDSDIDAEIKIESNGCTILNLTLISPFGISPRFNKVTLSSVTKPALNLFRRR